MNWNSSSIRLLFLESSLEASSAISNVPNVLLNVSIRNYNPRAVPNLENVQFESVVNDEVGEIHFFFFFNLVRLRELFGRLIIVIFFLLLKDLFLVLKESLNED